jgi:hypothetical protein
MQAFYTMKMLREVIKRTLRTEELGVLDIISNTVIIKLLSETQDNLEVIKFMSDLT